jgi:PKD repeat protein
VGLLNKKVKEEERVDEVCEKKKDKIMKRAYKSIITIVFVSLLTSLFSFSVAQSQVQTSLSSLVSAQQELFVSALVEGVKFTATSTGTYRFTIIGGASEVCPPEAQPDHPEWWGWKTEILIYKNRPIEWSGGPFAPEHPNPANWDFSVGDPSLQPTYEAAEQIGKGMFVDILLLENEYVILVVNDSKGYFWDNSGGIHLSIAILSPPVASFTYFPEKPVVGEEISFDASSSHDPDGEIVNYKWDFGDGNTAEGKVVKYTYSKPGTYTVTLVVTDNDGLKNSSQKDINVITLISGYVFKDEDGNGIFSSSEDIPIKDATVKAILNGEVKATTTTDENGYYSLELPAGSGYTLEASLPAGVKCYDPKEGEWGSSWSTIEGRTEGIKPPGEDTNIKVKYRALNYGPSDFSWELWHYGPVFDKENVVLVHGIQLPIFGGADKIREPDHHFVNLHNLLQRKKNGQYNVWLFEYADKDTGYTYNHLENYASYLKNAIDTINNLPNKNRLDKSVSSIIAHSMGGVVSRKFLQDNPAYNIKLLTLASPHFGGEFTHYGPFESTKDLMPAGSFLWDLNFNYQYGKYPFASIIGTNDLIIKVSAASLVQSPDKLNQEINYPSNYHFVTIEGRHHGVNNIQTEADQVFVYIMNFLSNNMTPFNQRPSEVITSFINTLRPYISFCYSKRARPWDDYPMVIPLENGIESGRVYKPSFFSSDFATKGERGKAIDLNGNLAEGWIWTYHAHPEDDGLHIYYAPDMYATVIITQGQSMVVKKLIGEPVVEETPNVAFQ